MSKKIVNINEYKEQKQSRSIPQSFTLYDVIEYLDIIDDYISKLKNLVNEDKKYYYFSISELINLLTNVFNSFVSIFDNEIKNYDYSLQAEKIIVFVLKKLNKACDEKEKDIYELNEFAKYINTLTNRIQYYYKKGKKDIRKCYDGQFEILSNIYTIFNEALLFVYDEFDYSKVYNRIIYNYLSEMYKIINNFTDIDEIKKNFDKKVLNFTQKKENNV